MTPDTFLDTSAFYALLVKADEAHDRMARWMIQAAHKRSRFATTDYVLDETATLLKARGHAHLVASFLSQVLASQSCRIVWMDAELFGTVTAFFAKHSDQAWSFTDCASFVVMKRMKLRVALTKDRHFRDAGFETPLIA